MKPKHIPYLNIFLSSPGDVPEERAIARKIMKRLPNRYGFKGRVALNIIAWEDPESGTAMEATLTPQEAIKRGLPLPSQCDIVIVVLWSRLGTPFTDDDGQRYESGTQWELLDALKSDVTRTYIYQRMEKLDPGDIDAPRYDENVAQYRRLKTFLASDVFYQNGEIKRAVQQYASPSEFEALFELHFEEIVGRILDGLSEDDALSRAQPPNTPPIDTAETSDWPPDKSPFPGLHAFTEDDADIFFGRGYETDALVRQVAASRFVAVVGASGSGKSSLVGAGLIPRLRGNAITGSKDWHIVRFNPDDAPFINMADALVRELPSLRLADILKAREGVVEMIESALSDAPEWAEVLLFIDQFEELFTLSSRDDAIAFARMLDVVAKSERVRVVVTMRHDFFNKAVENATLANILRSDAVFSLAIPKRDALRQMIERPAERAGLTFDHAMVKRILDDTGDEPGNLALMAYALDELYKLDDDDVLTHDEYEQLGGVQGAIGTRAENQFKSLNISDSVIQQVFHVLIEVDERGTAIRRRERFQPESLHDDVRQLIETFTAARLLTTSYDDASKTAIVEVAHEAILRSWPRLAEWIEDTQDDLRLLRQVRAAAHEWEVKGRRDFMLWPQERLTLVYAMQERLQPELNEVELDFIEPEQERLLRELEKVGTSHERRRDIGDRLAVIGDTRPGIGVKDGLLDIVWLSVKGSDRNYKFEFGKFQVPDFYIAKYQVTYDQYQVFSEGDYDNPRWWDGFTGKYRPQKLGGQRTKITNAPRDSISWYQSVAFARWLDAQLRDAGLLPDTSLQVRLPTEWEWQWAAMNGAERHGYPWPGGWREGYANTNEAGLNRTTAVGMYPHGAAICGALDMAGNLREWCVNNGGNPQIINVSNKGSKILRGGAFGYGRFGATTSYRHDYDPSHDDSFCGVRLVIAPVVPL